MGVFHNLNEIKNMEHSQFIEDFGLPIIGLFLFIIGVLAGLNLSVYLDQKND